MKEASHVTYVSVDVELIINSSFFNVLFSSIGIYCLGLLELLISIFSCFFHRFPEIHKVNIMRTHKKKSLIVIWPCKEMMF